MLFRTGFAFDLCINRQLGWHKYLYINIVLLQAVNFYSVSSRLISHYTKLDLRVLPLMFVIKKWSKCVGMHCSYLHVNFVFTNSCRNQRFSVQKAKFLLYMLYDYPFPSNNKSTCIAEFATNAPYKST